MFYRLLPHFKRTNLGESESIQIRIRTNPNLSESRFGRIRIYRNRDSVESESSRLRFRTNPSLVVCGSGPIPNPNRFDTESSNLIRIRCIPSTESSEESVNLWLSTELKKFCNEISSLVAKRITGDHLSSMNTATTDQQFLLSRNQEEDMIQQALWLSSKKSKQPQHRKPDKFDTALKMSPDAQNSTIYVDELDQAIALSLQETEDSALQRAGSPDSLWPNYASTEEEEDLLLAIKRSLQYQ